MLAKSRKEVGYTVIRCEVTFGASARYPRAQRVNFGNSGYHLARGGNRSRAEDLFEDGGGAGGGIGPYLFFFLSDHIEEAV